MKILCVFGEHNYGDPKRGHGYEYTNFLPAFRNLEHEVELFDSFSRSLYKDFSELNRALLKRVEKFEPELVFCVLMGYEVWLETLEIIRSTGIKIINWGTDDSWKYEQFSRYMAPAFDLWITTSYRAWQKAKEDGINNVVLSQWAASSDSLFEPFPASECSYEVSFVGSAYGNRPRLVSKLKALGIDVSCFGYGWPNGAVSAEEIPNIVRASKVSLNFGDSGIQFRGCVPYRSRQIKARVFEVPGAGGCLLTERAERMEEYYEVGREVEVFDGLDELAEKIGYLLNDSLKRDAMANAGFLRTKKGHTYEVRFAQFLAGIPLDGNIEPINFEKFESVVLYHQVDKTSLLLRSFIIFPFRLIWGSRRGARAARRVVFEFYWRFFGRNTYTAAGWPGRLFYCES